MKRGFTFEENENNKVKKTKFVHDLETIEKIKKDIFHHMEFNLPLANFKIISAHSQIFDHLENEFNNSDYKSKVKKNFTQKESTLHFILRRQKYSF
jgi:hypothetical protein